MPPGGNKGGGGNAGSNGNGGNGGKGGLNAIRGTNNADTLFGSDADDWVDGKGGDDLLFGGLGNDLIEGDQGNDTLVGGAGDDYLDGGHDIDTAVYMLDSVTASSTSAQDYHSVFGYDFIIGTSSSTITDVSGNNGTDTLVDVEYAVFSDADADGDGTAELLTIYLDGQNNAVLAVADSGAGDEDQDIHYDAHYLIANDVDFDGDAMELISVQDGVNGSVLMVGDLITFSPDDDYSGTASFTYTVSDGLGGLDTQIVRIDVAGVVDKPIVSVQDVSGDEDTAIALNLSAGPADTDGSEILFSLIVSDIPVGAKISDGNTHFTATEGNTQVDIVGWDQGALTITPPANSDVGFMLTVTAEAKEMVSNGDTETTDGTIAVTVNAVADAPDLDLDAVAPGSQLAISVAGDEDTAIGFDVSDALTDTDGSEILSLMVSGILVGATLTDGSNIFVASAGDTEVDISNWTSTGLTVTPPLDSDENFQLTVTATSTESSNGDTASTVGTIDVGVTGTVDTPTLDLDSGTTGDQLAGAASGDEDTGIVLDLSAALTDNDGSETLSVVVSGIPIGATLSNGTDFFTSTGGDTEVDIALWGSGVLTITPPADSDVGFPLTVTVTATEGSSGATSSTVGTIAVTVNAVADAPVVDLNAQVTGGQTVGAATGDQDTAIALDLAATVSDTDGSESLSALVVSAIPVGAILSDGTALNSFTSVAGSTEIDVLGWDLTSLTITPPTDSDTDFSLLVAATSIEAANGDMASTQGSIDVTVIGEVGAPTIYLGSLSPSEGFHIYGAEIGDQSGFRVSSAGDINGDGFDDVLIGANNANGGTGASYVVFGKASGLSDIDLGTLDPTVDGFAINGVDFGDGAGSAVSSAGDINGDGYDDLIVGASNADGPDDGTHDGVGESYVIFGKASGFSNIDLDPLSFTEGFTITGADAGDQSGFAVSSAGDINGDGFNDLIIGAYQADPAAGAGGGESYVIFGKASGFGDIDLGTLTPPDGFTISGGDPGDQVGWSVSSAGDVNGDGLDDVIVGANRALGSDSTETNAGQAYVIFGKAGGLIDIDVSTLTPADGFTIIGADRNDGAGYSVSAAGDVNGDGYEDVIVGANQADGAGNLKSNSGESYVVFGKSTGIGDIDLGALLATEGFTIRGADNIDFSGRSVTGAGDENGDGFDDLIVGAWFAEVDPLVATSTGESYVIFGKAGGFGPIDVSALTPTEGFTIIGADGGDLSGSSVSAAGDVDGDGFDDLIVGAQSAWGSGNLEGGAGESYVIFGSDLTGAVTHAGTSASETLTGTIDADVMVAGQGDDTVIGGGGEDVLIGAAGNDLLTIADINFARIDGGSGYDTVALEGANENLNLTQLGSAEIEGVEAFDLSGAGANALTLNIQDVLQLSDETNDLHIFGDGDDSVTLEGDFALAGQEIIDGTTFDVYASASTDARVLTEVSEVNMILV